MHLCLITTWHTSQVYTFKIYWEQKYSYMWSICFAWHLILTIFFSVSWPLIGTWLFIFFIMKNNIRCSFNFIFWRIEVVRYWVVKLHWIQQFGPKKLFCIRKREDPVFRGFFYIKNRREKFRTDEIVRVHGDSVIERIRFRGFYCIEILMTLKWHIHKTIQRKRLCFQHYL